jgi:hypothetical protein
MRPHGIWDDYNIAFTIIMIVKQRKLKCIECTYKGDDLYDAAICCTKFFEYDPS